MPSAPKPHRMHGDRTKQNYERWRGTSTERGYSVIWYRESRMELSRQIVESADPWCRYCGVNAATMMDHIMPPTRFHKVGTSGYDSMFWSRINWTPSCGSCNSVKGDKLPSETKEPLRSKLLAILKERGIAFR